MGSFEWTVIVQDAPAYSRGVDEICVSDYVTQQDSTKPVVASATVGTVSVRRVR